MLLAVLTENDPTLNLDQFFNVLSLSMESALKTGNWYRLTLLARFSGDLVTMKIVSPESFFLFVEPFLEEIESSSSDGKKSFFSYLLISVLYWNAQALYDQCEGLFRNLYVKIGSVILDLKEALQDSSANTCGLVHSSFHQDVRRKT